ncbi:MAG: hypothetical protein HC941_12985 [Microcoleus sp. SU_5_3]|nr:hypothetical protein [Microcoleus sp. SU_5_3]
MTPTYGGFKPLDFDNSSRDLLALWLDRQQQELHTTQTSALDNKASGYFLFLHSTENRRMPAP